MTQTPLITDWSAGELSPKMYGRADVPAFMKGAETIENFFVTEQGILTKRPGSVTKVAAYGNTNKPRLIPFVYDDTESYVVELTNSYLRVLRAGAVVAVSADPAYSATEIFEVQWCKDHNGLYLFHQNYPPKALVRTATDTFSFGSIAFTYLTTDGTLAVSSVTATTIVCTGAIGSAPATGIVCIIDGDNQYWFRYGSYASATFSGVTPDPTDYPAITNGDVLYVSGRPYDYHSAGSTPTVPFAEANNYPRTGAITGGRFVFAGTKNDPQRIWMSDAYGYSVSGGILTVTLKLRETISSIRNQLTDPSTWATADTPEYEKVAYVREVVGADRAIDITIASDENDTILWAAAGRHLLIGTTAAEWVIPYNITANSPRAQLMTRIGSAAIQAKLINDAMVFAQGSKKRIREYHYADSQAGYSAPDLTIMSDHIAGTGGITCFDYQQEPRGMIYFVRSDGEMAVLTYSKHTGVVAWQRWVPADSGTFVSVAVVPESGVDTVYVAVLRGSIYYIEVLKDPFPDSQNDIVFMDQTVDCGAGGAGNSPTSAWFANKTVAVVVDGAYSGDVVADGSGTVDLTSYSGTQVWVGMKFTSKYRSMPLPVQNETGSAQMDFKLIEKLFFRVYRTLDLNVGYDTWTVSECVSHTFGAVWETTDIEISFKGESDRDACFNVVSDDPLPLTITAIVPRVEV